MKLTIKVKLINGQRLPEVIKKGEWVDLRSNSYVEVHAPQAGVLHRKKNLDPNVEGGRVGYRSVKNEILYIPLGVAMKLPEGFEAIVAPRSSTPSKFGIIIPNSFGVIDNSYSGNEDEWKLIALPIADGTITRYDRVCQFRIQLSQKATIWQKLKWLFSSGIKFVEVDDLYNPSRGGIGSTGKN